jgi:flagellar basal body-associated protein FliL
VSASSCPNNYKGLRCEVESLESGKEDESWSPLVVVVLIGFLFLLALATFGVVFFLYRRRNGAAKSFAHVRMQDNVEITNPIYLREDDGEDPLEHSFTLDSDGKVCIHFLT